MKPIALLTFTALCFLATFSGCAQRAATASATVATGSVVASTVTDGEVGYPEKAPPTVMAAALKRTHEIRTEAEKRFLSQTSNAPLAWELARACFDCADLASNNTQRAQMAQAGIDAAQQAIALDPKLGAAYYYLGLNQGQLARTRKFSALRLLEEIERSWTKAIELDPTFDFAGPHRSIGILYRDAPGWPLSLGDSKKARQHLELAAKIAPDYPDNQICLLESYLDWGNTETVRAQIPTVRPKLQAARHELTGEAWELSWYDWNHRWDVIRSKVSPKQITATRPDGAPGALGQLR